MGVATTMPSAAATCAVASRMLGASKRACNKSSAGRLRTSSREAFTSRALMRAAIDRARRSVREVLEGLPEIIRTEVIEILRTVQRWRLRGVYYSRQSVTGKRLPLPRPVMRAEFLLAVSSTTVGGNPDQKSGFRRIVW